MAVTIFKSTNLESLAEELSIFFSKTPPTNPLRPEIIIVQSIGMGRWLSLQLARKYGVWTNFKYVYPNEFLRKISDASRLDLKTADRDDFYWSMMKNSHFLNGREFTGLRNFLNGGTLNISDDSSCIRIHQLIRSLSDLFDQYAVYRPEMVLEWDSGDGLKSRGKRPRKDVDYEWQSSLWKRTVTEERLVHSALFRKKLLEKMVLDPDIVLKVAKRLTVFGVSSLPPCHVEFLKKCGDFIDVNFYLMCPSDEFIEDILPDRVIARKSIRAVSTKISPEDLHYERGNPILSNMGGQGIEFFKVLAKNEYGESDYSNEIFVDSVLKNSANQTLLEIIQSDVHTLFDREEEKLPARIMDNDKSIMVHVCHSKMRELEVLHDRLLSILNDDHDVGPSDILVMTPDIESYSSYIEAVFGNVESENKKIPFSIADRPVRKSGVIVDTFLLLFQADANRFKASFVLDLLSCVPLREKFRLNEPDVEVIAGYVSSTRVCWGRDANDRLKRTSIKYDSNSWTFGVERLLAGYAFKEEDNEWENIMPFDVEGTAPVVIGRFLDFYSTLSFVADEILVERNVENWCVFVRDVLNFFFKETGDNLSDFTIIKSSIDKIRKKSSAVGFSEKISFQTIYQILEEDLSEKKNEFGFMTGKATFCEMLPMRSIPFKVIAMLGMDGSSFPRVARPRSFDLIARFPSTGDRSQRKDDSYLFLETILSARKYLHVSYCGMNSTDNTVRPPSSLVNVLLEYIDRNFRIDDENERSPVEKIVVRHRLNPFSLSYFDGSMDRSYSEKNLTAAIGMFSNDKRNDPLFSDYKFTLKKEMLTLTPENLINFLFNPARYFFRNVSNIKLHDYETEINDQEPFEIYYRDGYELFETILDDIVSGKGTDVTRRKISLKGMLPPLSYGDAVYSMHEKQTVEFAKRLNKYLSSESTDFECSFSFEINGYKINIAGEIKGLRKNGMFVYSKADSVKHRIRLWVNHLLLSQSGMEDIMSIFFHEDGGYSCKKIPFAESKKYIESILEIYLEGITRPIKFFPKASFKFTEKFFAGKGELEAIENAFTSWNNLYARFPEPLDPYVVHAFTRHGITVFDAEFIKFSKMIFLPILENMEAVLLK